MGDLTQTNRNRFLSLDFLKYILSIVIIFHHYQQVTGVAFAPPFINFFGGKIYFGFVSEFFFIISGFVAALSIEKTMQSDFGTYFAHKLKRIYPMTIVATLFTALLLLAYPVVFGSSFRGIVPSLWRLFNSLLIVFAGGAVKDVETGINHPIWYLGVLIICYAIFWLILRICKKDKSNALYFFGLMCIIGVGVLQYQLNLPFLNEYSGRGYAAFFFGIILNYIYKRYDSRILGIVSAIVLVVCIGLGLYSFDTFYDNVWGIMVFIIIPAILFIFLSVNSLFHSDIWGKLGEVSFEMYIWHSAFNIILCAILELSGISADSPLIMIMLALFMTLIGFIIRRFLEKPVNTLFSRL